MSDVFGSGFDAMGMLGDILAGKSQKLADEPFSLSAAGQAGREGRYHACQTRQELGDWFQGVSLHCCDILAIGKPPAEKSTLPGS